MKIDDLDIYAPDGVGAAEALRRTTHLAFAAHPDDLELMALAPIAECYGAADKFFCGVVAADGAGSPRCGRYQNYTDEEMRAVRVAEQKRAADAGKYGALIMLGRSSAQVKDARDTEIAAALSEILRTARPQFVYTHNLADKHETHVAAALKCIAALRTPAEGERPGRVYGCEVWRGLDWLNDDDKTLLDCGTCEPLGRALMGVFDSQIGGGKRYDRAAEGRRLANATFFASHACDGSAALAYAMDLTPLISDKELSAEEYVRGYIDRFADAVGNTIRKLS